MTTTRHISVTFSTANAHSVSEKNTIHRNLRNLHEVFRGKAPIRLKDWALTRNDIVLFCEVDVNPHETPDWRIPKHPTILRKMGHAEKFLGLKDTKHHSVYYREPVVKVLDK